MNPELLGTTAGPAPAAPPAGSEGQLDGALDESDAEGHFVAATPPDRPGPTPAASRSRKRALHDPPAPPGSVPRTTPSPALPGSAPRTTPSPAGAESPPPSDDTLRAEILCVLTSNEANLEKLNPKMIRQAVETKLNVVSVSVCEYECQCQCQCQCECECGACVRVRV